MQKQATQISFHLGNITYRIWIESNFIKYICRDFFAHDLGVYEWQIIYARYVVCIINRQFFAVFLAK